MIDIHTHILPGIDDGAVDPYDTLEMARIAADSGVRSIVATPHCNVPGMYSNYYGEEYIKLFQETERMLLKERIPITLYSGMEVFLTSDVLRLLREGKLLTLNGGHYMLVEFAFDEEPEYAESMLGKISELGIKPVVAHPERYEFVQDDLQIVYYWRRAGYQVQVNKGSLQGRFGRHAYETAHRILKHRLVSVIASDAHGPYKRTPYMLDVYEELAQDYSERYLKILFEENPMRICKDQQTIRVELHPFAEENW